MAKPTSATTQSDLASVDLADLELWVHGPPHDLFSRMRREAPVHWSPAAGHPDETGFWSLTRAADIAAVSKDTATYSSQRRTIVAFDELGVPLEMQNQMMISMDPPRHDRMKALVQRAFTPRRVADHERRIREIVKLVFDGVGERGECDLVQDVAVSVPAMVIGDMLGVPRSDAPLMVDWTNRSFGFDEPRLRPDADDAMRALGEMAEYLAAMIAERHARPTDDLTTALIEAELDGERLTDGEILMFFGLLMLAGNDSTRSTYSSGMVALMEHPDQRQHLLDDPSLYESAVEEMLRFAPAFSHFARTATLDTEIGGQPIAEGDKVVMWYVSSCRDEEVYADPQRFDVTRQPNPHQAFGGGGRHFCLGAGLARLELRIWLEETLRRFPRMQAAGEPVHARSTLLNQYLSIPVSLI